MNYSNYEKWRKIALAIVGFATFVSCYFSFLGMLNDGSGGADGFNAFVRTLLVGVFGFAAFAFAFSFYPRSSSGDRRKMLVGMGIVSVVLISMSSVYGVGGMVESRVTLHHLRLMVDEAEKVRDGLLARRRSEESLVTPLETSAEAFKVHAKNEKKKGVVSRRWGRGPNAANIKGLVSGFSEAADRLTKQKAKTDTLETRTKRLITEVREAVDNPEVPLDEKSRFSQEKFNELNGQFSRLQISNLATTASFIERIDQMFLIGGERYDEALASLREPIATSKAHILERVAEIGQKRRVTVKRFRTLDKLELIHAYPLFCITEIIGALSTDLIIPLFFLWVLTFLAARLSPEMTETKPNDAEVSNVGTRPELKDASAWLERRARIGQDKLQHPGTTRKPGGGNGVSRQPPAS